MRTLHVLPAVSVLLLAACAATSDFEPAHVHAEHSRTTAERYGEAVALVQSGRFEEAADLLEGIVAEEPSNGAAWHYLGYSRHVLGDLERARAAHALAYEHGDPQVRGLGAYNSACVNALLGDEEAAFEWLERCVEAGFAQTDMFATDPDFDSLRDDPRFDDIVGG